MRRLVLSTPQSSVLRCFEGCGFSFASIFGDRTDVLRYRKKNSMRTIIAAFDSERIDDSAYGLVAWRLFWRTLPRQEFPAGVKFYCGDLMPECRYYLIAVEHECPDFDATAFSRRLSESPAYTSVASLIDVDSSSPEVLAQLAPAGFTTADRSFIGLPGTWAQSALAYVESEEVRTHNLGLLDLAGARKVRLSCVRPVLRADRPFDEFVGCEAELRSSDGELTLEIIRPAQPSPFLVEDKPQYVIEFCDGSRRIVCRAACLGSSSDQIRSVFSFFVRGKILAIDLEGEYAGVPARDGALDGSDNGVPSSEFGAYKLSPTWPPPRPRRSALARLFGSRDRLTAADLRPRDIKKEPGIEVLVRALRSSVWKEIETALNVIRRPYSLEGAEQVLKAEFFHNPSDRVAFGLSPSLLWSPEEIRSALASQRLPNRHRLHFVLRTLRTKDFNYIRAMEMLNDLTFPHRRRIAEAYRRDSTKGGWESFLHDPDPAVRHEAILHTVFLQAHQWNEDTQYPKDEWMEGPGCLLREVFANGSPRLREVVALLLAHRTLVRCSHGALAEIKNRGRKLAEQRVAALDLNSKEGKARSKAIRSKDFFRGHAAESRVSAEYYHSQACCTGVSLFESVLAKEGSAHWWPRHRPNPERVGAVSRELADALAILAGQTGGHTTLCDYLRLLSASVTTMLTHAVTLYGLTD